MNVVSHDGQVSLIEFGKALVVMGFPEVFCNIATCLDWKAIDS
jgi:hypothetical protein